MKFSIKFTFSKSLSVNDHGIIEKNRSYASDLQNREMILERNPMSTSGRQSLQTKSTTPKSLEALLYLICCMKIHVMLKWMLKRKHVR